MNSYDQIVWEPLNEPSSLSFPMSNTAWCIRNQVQCDDNETSYMSMQYQSWLNRDRDMGDAHWVVVQNMCSFTCNKDRDEYYLDYPTINDTVSHVFESGASEVATTLPGLARLLETLERQGNGQSAPAPSAPPAEALPERLERSNSSTPSP